MKQKFSFALAFPKVLSKFLTKLFQRSTQAFERSTTHRFATGTNPNLPSASFSALDGLGDSSSYSHF
jgi:hypothetical protein